MIKYTIPFLLFLTHAMEFDHGKILNHRFKSCDPQDYVTYVPRNIEITTPRSRSMMLPKAFSAPVTPTGHKYTVDVRTSQTSSNSYNPVNVNVTDITIGYVRNCYKLDKYLIFPCEQICYGLTCGAILLLQFDTGYEAIFKYTSLISGVFAFTFNKIHDTINKKIKREDGYLFDARVNQ